MNTKFCRSHRNTPFGEYSLYLFFIIAQVITNHNRTAGKGSSDLGRGLAGFFISGFMVYTLLVPANG